MTSGSPARRGRRARGRVVLAAIALATLAAAAPAAPVAPAEAAAPLPVVLVHGFNGAPAAFITMAARLRERKHTVVIAKLPGNDNLVNAKVIGGIVAARGWKKVAIVGHSMGGLSSRQYVRFDGGRKVTTVYVSLGTPQRGLPIACLLQPTNGGQMCPDSPFLRRLNAGDETPGATAWTSVYSTTDGLVPTSASRLVDGACDVRVTGPSHGQLLTDPAVFRIVLGAIDGKPCPGTVVK
ncbi:MAG: alpha/beta fold hydrolase [Chloroflexi bacterium]|jgi:triacylglycerol lipase|nr:alpha/beta fold hydrolase [Chloroflexota bacterium]